MPLEMALLRRIPPGRENPEDYIYTLTGDTGNA